LLEQQHSQHARIKLDWNRVVKEFYARREALGKVIKGCGCGCGLSRFGSIRCGSMRGRANLSLSILLLSLQTKSVVRWAMQDHEAACALYEAGA